MTDSVTRIALTQTVDADYQSLCLETATNRILTAAFAVGMSTAEASERLHDLAYRLKPLKHGPRPKSADRAEVVYKGLLVTGLIFDGGYEGDPSIRDGLNKMGDYVEDVRVYNNDGPDRTEITDLLTPQALDECEAVLLGEWGE